MHFKEQAKFISNLLMSRFFELVPNVFSDSCSSAEVRHAGHLETLFCSPQWYRMIPAFLSVWMYCSREHLMNIVFPPAEMLILSTPSCVNSRDWCVPRFDLNITPEALETGSCMGLYTAAATWFGWLDNCMHEQLLKRQVSVWSILIWNIDVELMHLSFWVLKVPCRSSPSLYFSLALARSFASKYQTVMAYLWHERNKIRHTVIMESSAHTAR